MFDSAACIRDLRSELILAMKQLQQELLAEAQKGMLTPEGRDSLHDDEIKDIANVIIASIVGGAWAAMDEWGTGSLMDTSNPALDDYKRSNMWNPARHDNKIRTRPNAPGQINIFGKPVNGKGAGGIDLEGLGIYEAQPPSHAIQTAARWMDNGRMQSVIRNVISTFPFSRFIITDKK